MGVRTLALAVIGISLFGCGGGSEATHATETDFGDLAVTGNLNATPLTATKGTATAIGLAGKITGLKVRNIDPCGPESRILVSSTSSVSVMSPDAKDIKAVAPTGAGLTFPDLAWQAGTGKMYYRRDSAGLPQWFSADRFGGSVTSLPGYDYYSQIRWSPNSKLAAIRLFGQTWISNFDGTTTSANLDFGATTTLGPAWVDEQTLLVSGRKPSDSVDRLYLVNIGTATTALLYAPGVAVSQLATLPSLGLAAAVESLGPNASTVHVFYGLPAKATRWAIAIDANVTSVAFAPDGRSVIIGVQRNGSWSVERVWLQDSRASEKMVGGYGDPIAQVDWFAAPRDRILVGSGAPLGNTASCVLATFRDGVRSTVACDATTPSSLTITDHSGTGGTQFLVFDIRADALTRVIYTSDASYKATTVVGSGGTVTTATGVIVAISTDDGLVSSAIPYTGVMPNVRMVGDKLKVGD